MAYIMWWLYPDRLPFDKSWHTMKIHVGCTLPTIQRRPMLKPFKSVPTSKWRYHCRPMQSRMRFSRRWPKVPRIMLAICGSAWIEPATQCLTIATTQKCRSCTQISLLINQITSRELRIRWSAVVMEPGMTGSTVPRVREEHVIAVLALSCNHL